MRRSYRRAGDYFCRACLGRKQTPPLQPVNLNTATALELQQVPGIGPSTADRILKMRKSYGQFKSVDELRAIKGIGPKRMEKMRKHITVGKPVAPKRGREQRSSAVI
jgi:competence ComEA-like helix-hairpin-helix protein